VPRGRPSRTTVYARLHRALADLSTRYGGLPSPSESQSVWSDIWHLEAHHSTALEGNTLVLREVEALLERGRAVGAKPLSEYMEVKGYGDAAQWVYAQAQSARQNDVPLMSVQEVRRVHHEVMAPVWAVAPHAGATTEESPGSFRRHDIRAFDGGMTPPTWPLVPAEITAWVEAANDTASSLTTPPAATSEPMPEVISRIHTDFEKIHPFLDGNGRTGRLLLNLVLVRLGFPPVIILKRQRPAYLAALEVADRGEYGPLGELFARAMLDNINRFEPRPGVVACRPRRTLRASGSAAAERLRTTSTRDSITGADAPRGDDLQHCVRHARDRTGDPRAAFAHELSHVINGIRELPPRFWWPTGDPR